MGTVATVGNKARDNVDDPSGRRFTDAMVLGVINDILGTIYQTLVNVNSNLVYATDTVTTVASTAEYTPSFSFDGFLREGSWVDGEDLYLEQVSEADKIKWDYDSSTSQPEAFYVTEDGKIGYLWVPDDAYTIHHTYWKPLTALTDYDIDNVPWGGIWDIFVERKLTVELLEIENDPKLQNKIVRLFSVSQMEFDKAMTMVYHRGIRREKQVSRLFSIGGI